MNTQPEILLNQVARRCSKEMIQAGTRNMDAHKVITTKYAAILKEVGFSKIEMMSEIGRINKQLRDR